MSTKASSGAKAASVKPGDHVSWSTSQGQTEGTVTKKITGEGHAGGHTAHASKDAPQYEVKSDKTGKTAIHKPEALHKTKAGAKK